MTLPFTLTRAVVLPVLLTAVLVVIRWHFGLLAFHTFAELFSIIVGILMFVVAWHTHQFTRNYFLLFLGIGYFNIAILDAFHMLTMYGLSIFPNESMQTTVHLWLYARLVESIVLLSAPLFLVRQFNPKLFFNVGVLLTSLLVFLAFEFETPILLTAHGLTPIKITAEYLVVSILLVAAMVYWQNKVRLTYPVNVYLLSTIVLTIAAELSFTLYVNVNGMAFVVGHILKFISFWLAYQVIIQTMLTRPVAMLARHSGIYDAIPHIAIVTDLMGNIVQLNKAAKHYLGINEQQIMQSNEHSLLHSNEVDQTSCALCLATRNGQIVDNFLLQRATQQHWFLVSSAPLNIHDVQQGMVHVYTDITAAKNAEITASQGKAIVESVFNVLPDIFILMDFDTKVLEYQANDHQVLNIEPDDLLGKPLTLALPGDVADLFKQHIIEAKLVDSIVSFDYPFLLNQERRYFEARISKTKDMAHLVVVIRDITDKKLNDQALVNSEHLYRQMFEENQAIKLIVDPDGGQIIQANQAAKDFYGYGEGLFQKTIMDLRIGDMQEIQAELSLARSKNKTIFYCKHQLASGDIRQIEVYTGPVNVGDKCYLYSVIQDVTERDVAKQSLLVKERQLQDLVDNTTSLIYIKNLQGQYISVNRQYEKLLGVSKSDLIGKTDHELFPKRFAEIFHQNDLSAITNNEPLEFEESLEYRGEQHFYISIKFPLKNNDNEVYGVCGISTDITARKVDEQKIYHQAHFDVLTQLPNRFLSLDRLTQMLSEAKRNNEKLAVLFLDLDDFKRINDSLGHEVGDKLLVEAAIRLQQIVRGNDTVGRLGGDEFIILLRQLTNKSYAHPVIELLLEAFRQPFQIDGRELLLTLSVGVAIYPDDGETGTVLLKNADIAMYHAKAQGRNTFSYFTDEMNQHILRQLEIEEQLRGALERGEFSVNYQPQISVASGKVIGAEALVRWFNPTLKQVSPVEFIPLAEQSGLIVALGKFVLAEALAVIAQWQHQNSCSLRMAVNLSPRQFRDPSLVSFVQQALETAQVEPDKLELEITEGVLLSGHQFVENALNGLAQLGVLLSMDDFGTGYSSLSYLRKFAFNVLKIDRSFVHGLTETKADRELVYASIALAHSLELKVVAEGVETAEQLALLNELGCDYAQGFYLAKPMTSDALLAFKHHI